jgi:CheY-like chemotaxis protein
MQRSGVRSPRRPPIQQPKIYENIPDGAALSWVAFLLLAESVGQLWAACFQNLDVFLIQAFEVLLLILIGFALVRRKTPPRRIAQPSAANGTRLILVEEDAGNAEQFRTACAGWLPARHFQIAADGRSAIEQIKAHPPHLILLGLNLPDLSGHEVLLILKSEPQLRRIPVLMFSSSASDEDVDLAYEAGAACFICNPEDVAELQRICAGIEQMWLGIASLPQTRNRAGDPTEVPL